MILQKLRECFSTFKDVKGVDFSIYNSDRYGDCNSCVWCEISDVHGEDSKGIWRKYRLKGMNKGKPIKELDHIYIAHRLDENLAKEFYRVFSKYYEIGPEEWDDNECFILIEK